MTLGKHPPMLVQLARLRAARLRKEQTSPADDLTRLVRTIAWNAIERNADAARWVACRAVNHMYANHILPADLEGPNGKLAIEALIICIDVEPKSSRRDLQASINEMMHSWRHRFWRNLFRSVQDEIEACAAYPDGFEIRRASVHEHDRDGGPEGGVP